MTSPFVHPCLTSLIEGNLDVSYQCSAVQQDLHVDVDFGTQVNLTNPIIWLRTLEDFGRIGLCGGAVFPPEAAVLKVTSGPMRPSARLAGPTVQWTIGSSGFCPEFLAVLLRQLALGTGHGIWAKAVRLTGSRPLEKDRPELFVDGGKAAAMLERGVNPTRWAGGAGFAWKVGKAKASAARLSLQLDRAPSSKATRNFDSLATVVATFANLMASADRSDQADIGGAALSSTRSALIATWKPFDVEKAAFEAAVHNAVAFFHSATTPVVEAELLLP